VPIDYLDSQIPSSDDYLIDPDISTLRLSTGYPIDSWLNKKIQLSSDRTATRKNAKKRYDFKGLGQNQSLTFHYDNV